MKYWKFLSVLAITAAIAACSSDDSPGTGGENTNPDTFNRGEMLVNWADNIIIPAYTAFKADADALTAASNVFTAAPTLQNLQQLRNSWQTAYLSFQNVSMFEIGKAEEVRYRNRLNIYPTSVVEIEAAIAEGNYNLELPSAVDAQGFPAIDYLLNGLGDTDEAIVAFYTTHPNAAGYKSYLTTVSTAISDLTTTVLNDWNNGYRDAFVSNTSSSSSGAVDKLTNDYIFYYEKSLRAGKVGIPAGIFSTEPLPENVEAFYKKDVSKQLLLQAITASEDFFNGKHFNSTATGPSYKSYLDYLNSVKNGEDLSALINAQFDLAKTKATTLNNNFVQQIDADNEQMLLTYNELQRNVILLKVDMLQALDINVDYVDTDGD